MPYKPPITSKSATQAVNAAMQELRDRHREEYQMLIDDERAKRGLPPIKSRPASWRKKPNRPLLRNPEALEVIPPATRPAKASLAIPAHVAAQLGQEAPTAPTSTNAPIAPETAPVQAEKPPCKHLNRKNLGWGTLCEDCGKVLRL